MTELIQQLDEIRMRIDDAERFLPWYVPDTGSFVHCRSGWKKRGDNIICMARCAAVADPVQARKNAIFIAHSRRDVDLLERALRSVAEGEMTRAGKAESQQERMHSYWTLEQITEIMNSKTTEEKEMKITPGSWVYHQIEEQKTTSFWKGFFIGATAAALIATIGILS